MVKVKFLFDKDKEIYNLYRSATKGNHFMDEKHKYLPKKLVELVKGKDFNKCKNQLSKFRKKIYDSGFIEPFVFAVNKSWQKIEKEYFKRLKRITGKPPIKGKIKGYITTVSQCPYDTDEQWFMISFFSHIPSCLMVAGHEIFHLQIHKYFWRNMEDKIGFEKTDNIKEAITTVMLNEEFRDLWFVEDKGYDMHKNLREFIKKQWKRKKDFNSLIKNCIIYSNNK